MPELDIDPQPIGFSGLKHYGGILAEEWHPRLRGTLGPKVYREMADNSSTVGAIRYVMTALMRQVKWRVDPADRSDASIEAASLLETALLDMDSTFEEVLSEILSFLYYGWACVEPVYKIRRGKTTDPTTTSNFDDGKIGWRKLASRAQDTLDHWEIDKDGVVQGMHQVDYSTGRSAFLPIDRMVLFRTEPYKGSPEGRSILRNAVVDYYYLKRIQEIEAIGIDRDMTGMIVMEVPAALLSDAADQHTRALRSSLEKMLGELKRDEREFAIVPSETDQQGRPTGFKLKLLSSGGRRQIDTTAVKQGYKINILQSVAAQFLELGMQGVGSFALASSQTSLFSTALGSFLDNIAATLNRYAVDRLMELNGVAFENRPVLVHGDIETQDLNEIGQYVERLARGGFLPADFPALQRKLLELGGLPQPELEEASA